METKARISNISRDFSSGKVLLTFRIDHYEAEEVDRLMSKDLRLKAVIWREKRSLDQNSYYWVLTDKIAAVLGTTKEEVHEIMLHRYGMFDLIDGKPIVITIRSDIDISHIEGHYKVYKASEDGKFISYFKLKGSSEMNTEEMSRLLSGTIEEAKILGVEVLPPDELERMRQLEVNNSKR